MTKTYGYFKNLAIVETNNHFFCHGCLVDKPKDDLSTDPRYCLLCFDFLLEEAKMQSIKKAGWVPKVVKLVSQKIKVKITTAGAAQKAVEVAQIKPKRVSKIKLGLLPTPQQDKLIMKHRGRPRKTVDLSRITKWRRKKELQGVLL